MIWRWGHPSPFLLTPMGGYPDPPVSPTSTRKNILLGPAIFSSPEVSTAAAASGADAGCRVARNISGLQKANDTLYLRIHPLPTHKSQGRTRPEGKRQRKNRKWRAVCHCPGGLESSREDAAGVCESRDCPWGEDLVWKISARRRNGVAVPNAESSCNGVEWFMCFGRNSTQYFCVVPVKFCIFLRKIKLGNLTKPGKSDKLMHAMTSLPFGHC